MVNPIETATNGYPWIKLVVPSDYISFLAWVCFSNKKKHTDGVYNPCWFMSKLCLFSTCKSFFANKPNKRYFTGIGKTPCFTYLWLGYVLKRRSLINSSTALSVSVTRSVWFSFFNSIFEPAPAMRESTAALMIAPASWANWIAKSRYSWILSNVYRVKNQIKVIAVKFTLLRHLFMEKKGRKRLWGLSFFFDDALFIYRFEKNPLCDGTVYSATHKKSLKKSPTENHCLADIINNR